MERAIALGQTPFLLLQDNTASIIIHLGITLQYNMGICVPVLRLELMNPRSRVGHLYH